MFTTEGSTALPTLRKIDDRPSTCDSSSRVALTLSSARAKRMSCTSPGPKKNAPSVPPATAIAANDFRNECFIRSISLVRLVGADDCTRLYPDPNRLDRSARPRGGNATSYETYDR